MSAHWYSATGELVPPYTKGAYPSVTTILDVVAKPALEDWATRVGPEEAARKMLEAQERGTAVHQAIEDHLKGVEPAYLNEREAAMFQGFLNWRESVDFEPIACEVFVSSKKHKYRGTIDIVARVNGELWIIDTKTGAHRRDHGLQVKAYQQAWFEMTGERARMAILRVTDTTKKGWQWREYKEPLKPFLGLNNHLKWQSRGRKPAVESTEVWSPDTARFAKAVVSAYGETLVALGEA